MDLKKGAWSETLKGAQKGTRQKYFIKNALILFEKVHTEHSCVLTESGAEYQKTSTFQQI